MNPLIGKKVVAVYLAEDKKAIKFDVEDGEPIIAKTDGDCYILVGQMIDGFMTECTVRMFPKENGGRLRDR